MFLIEKTVYLFWTVLKSQFFGNVQLQAGHVEVVSFLLTKVRGIQVDPVNNQGFTPLMKAALQGRVKCSKLLLFSGKNVNLIF